MFGRRLLCALACAVAVTTGCGTSPEEQACLDVADAVADAAGRCGFDVDANRRSFINAVAGGDCGNITRVRDSDELYMTCIPSIEAISCPDLTAGNLDASCLSQLLRPE